MIITKNIANTFFFILFILLFSGDLFAKEKSTLVVASARSAADTGIIDYLIEKFKKENPSIKVISKHAGALEVLDIARNGGADVVITHHPGNEKLFISENYGLLRTQLMSSEYAIMGNLNNSLNINQNSNIIEILSSIKESESPFLSPHPRSGTYQKIQELWTSVGISVDWLDAENTMSTGSATLNAAANSGAFTISEIGLYYTHKKYLPSDYVPLYRGHSALKNIYSIIVTNPKKIPHINYDNALIFYNFMTSDSTQSLISKYGEKKFNALYMMPMAHLDKDLINRKTQEELALKTKQVKTINQLNTWLILSCAIIVLMFFMGMYFLYNSMEKDKKRAIEINARKMAELASKNKSLFLAKMSHELRSPLTSIIGFSDLINKKNNLPEKEANRIKNIHKNGKHLLSIVNNILDLSKIEAGKLELEMIEFNFKEFMEEVNVLAGDPIRNSGLDFEIRYSWPLPVMITADKTRLKQVIINLCNNASKFTEAGKVSLTVNYDEDKKQLQFHVIDTGIGMDQDQLNKIFTSYQQAEASIHRKYGGTGLGLCISQEFIEAMGGKIKVSSKKNKGSDFSFFIHVPEYHEVSYNFNQPPGSFSGKSIPTLIHKSLRGSKDVLVIDPILKSQEETSHYLQSFGLNTITANNKEDALKLTSNKSFSAIFINPEYGNIHNIIILQEIRNKDYKNPIIAISNDLAIYTENNLAEFCNDFLISPLSFLSLSQILQKHKIVMHEKEVCKTNNELDESSFATNADFENDSSQLTKSS